MKTTSMLPSTSRTLVLCELADPGIEGVESFSTFSLKVHRALKLAGLAYETRRGRAPSDFTHLNPLGQVPVLLLDDEVVVDSTRILETIEGLAPGALVPRDAYARAEAWLWEDWADQSLSGFVGYSRWLDPRNWPLLRAMMFRDAPRMVRPLLEALVAPQIRKRAAAKVLARDVGRLGHLAFQNDFRRMLDMLEARAPLTGFWVGERPTVADLAMFAQLHSLRTSLTSWQAREIILRPALTDWLDRVDLATSVAAPRDASVPMPRLAPPVREDRPAVAPYVAARIPLSAAAFCG